ncbi:MAG: DUF4242 domain-containing protein [Gemmatimonadaceae bacterium]
MNRYVIERELAGAGDLTPSQIQGASQTSNAALKELRGSVQWVRSFVTADRIYCEYFADSEQHIRDHAKAAGLPCTKISLVARVIDPITGFTPV